MNIGTLLPYVGKAIAFMNVKEKMDNNPQVMDRPFWLSGRFIGMAMTAVFGSCAAGIGMNLETSITSVTELANLIFDNKLLFASVGGMFAGIVRGVVGYFQRKK